MSTIDRSSPMPLWAQLLAVLRDRLAAGEFTDGFPTDLQLTEQYGLSRHTVREAVRRLQDEGTISRERGRGTFVNPLQVDQPYGALYSLFRSIESQGHEQRSQVLALAETTDVDVAGRLGLAPDEPLVKLERIRFVDGHPLAHDTAWLPAAMARPLLDVDFTHTGLYDELQRRCGVRPDAGTESVQAVEVDFADRERLGVRARQPVFAIERLSTAGGRPVEWRRSVVRADRYRFTTTWSSSGHETSMSAAPT